MARRLQHVTTPLALGQQHDASEDDRDAEPVPKFRPAAIWAPSALLITRMRKGGSRSLSRLIRIISIPMNAAAASAIKAAG
jgi:hypothetical protein